MHSLLRAYANNIRIINNFADKKKWWVCRYDRVRILLEQKYEN